MPNQLRSIIRAHQKQIERIQQVKLRKHLNADALFHSLRDSFGKIKDHRSKNAVIPLLDVLMSAFAMFSLKDQSLLSFDQRRKQGGHNLRTIFGISTIPCDISPRHILDGLKPIDPRPAFKEIFAGMRCAKVLEKYIYG